MIQRYKAIIEYDGTRFNGWQYQEPSHGYGIGVQNFVQDALKQLFRQKISVVCAGRTDTGVHAKGQVIHFDAPNIYDAFKIQSAVNFYLKPNPISILSLEEASNDFSARFDAISREYEYHIINRRSPLTFMENRAWLVVRPLNLDHMHQAAQAFIGTHDLTTFRARGCQANSPVKTIYAVNIQQISSEHLTITTRAQSFLYNQVRAMVGSLVKVGDGTETVDFISRILQAKDRSQCGVVAPPCGLYFNHVAYPSAEKKY